MGYVTSLEHESYFCLFDKLFFFNIGGFGLAALIILNKIETKIEFYQQCVELTDFILDGYKNQLNSLSHYQDRQKTVLKMYEKDCQDVNR